MAKRSKNRSTGQETIERKIFFYRIDAGQDESGKPIAYDPKTVLRHINSLPFEPNGRYWRQQDGNDIWCHPCRLNDPCRVIFGRSIRRDFPQQELGGKLSGLKIDAGGGIAHKTHIVFFSNNIVGAEFNFYAPRASGIGKYFTVVANNQAPNISLDPLDRGHILEKVNDVRDVRFFQLRVQRGYTDVVGDADKDLGEAFKAAAKVGEADILEVVLRCRKDQEAMDDGILGKVRSLVRSRDLRQGTAKFLLKGFVKSRQKFDEVDLLKSALLSKREIVLLDEKYLVVRSDSAFEQIEAAYKEMKPLIEKAASIRVL